MIIFIVATAGLLTWAAVKPWVGGWIDVGYKYFCPVLKRFLFSLFRHLPMPIRFISFYLVSSLQLYAFPPTISTHWTL